MQKDSVYYIKITAENEFGEGYSMEPFMIRTAPFSPESDLCCLYSWGSNNNCQLGFSDDFLKENSAFYHNEVMTKGLKNKQLQHCVTQVATGNTTSLFLFYDEETKDSMIIQSGATIIANEENSEQNKFDKNELQKTSNIPSTPFEISFRIPVSKVACGDMFSAALTSEGEVFTWGYNLYG